MRNPQFVMAVLAWIFQLSGLRQFLALDQISPFPSRVTKKYVVQILSLGD